MVKKLIQHANSAASMIEKPILPLLDIGMDTNLEIVTDRENALLQSLAKVNAQHRNTLAKLAQGTAFDFSR